MTEETINKILKFRDDRDWKQFHNPKDLAISISLEAAELLEVFQWSGTGFGNHDPGKGRHQGTMPQWDCLHPGRTWAERLQPCVSTAEQLAERVKEYLEDN